MTNLDTNLSAAALPVHEIVYQDLRALILFGEFIPGEAVTIQGLATRLSAGLTPVREAIRRLTAEGALSFNDNRRVCVPTLSLKDLEDVSFARQFLEPKLIFMAAQQVTAQDITALITLDSALDQAIFRGDAPMYLRLNYQFHHQLYQLARAPILSALTDGLWLRFGPSLRIVCGRLGTLHLVDQHKETLLALKAGDAQAASDAILQDVLQGMEQIRIGIV